MVRIFVDQFVQHQIDCLVDFAEHNPVNEQRVWESYHLGCHPIFWEQRFWCYIPFGFRVSYIIEEYNQHELVRKLGIIGKTSNLLFEEDLETFMELFNFWGEISDCNIIYQISPIETISFLIQPFDEYKYSLN